MADYRIRIETIRRLVIALHLPTNWIEVQKAIEGMHDQLSARDIDEYDDAVIVEADEEELRFIAFIDVDDDDD